MGKIIKQINTSDKLWLCCVVRREQKKEIHADGETTTKPTERREREMKRKTAKEKENE